MPRYIVTRTLPPLTPDQLKDVGRRVKSVSEELGLRWIRSHLTADGKHSFCEFEASDADVLRRHAELAGLPYDEVVAIGMEMGPDQFSN